MPENDWERDFPDLLLPVMDNEDLVEDKMVSSFDGSSSHIDDGMEFTEVFSSLDCNGLCLGSNGPSLGPVMVDKCVGNTATNNVMHIATSKTSFLDDLKSYEDLKENGIPSRHTRRSFHPIAFRAARILGMTEREADAEWLRIVSKNPQAIGCSPEEALRDFQVGRTKGKKANIYLPDCSQLPVLTNNRDTALQKRLKALRCPYAYGCRRIIQNVLWEQIRSLPRQCIEGELGIRSRELQAAYRQYKKPMGWMIEQKLMNVTDHCFIRGAKTKRYWVNIPLVLFWLGFKTEDLVWDTVPKAVEKVGAALQPL